LVNQRLGIDFECVANAEDVRPQPCKIDGLHYRNCGLAIQNGSNRGLDIGSADCADITLGLCDDYVRVQLFEGVIMHLVNTECILHEPADTSIDLDTGSILVKLGRRADR
jgi:hypothetical protein